MARKCAAEPFMDNMKCGSSACSQRGEDTKLLNGGAYGIEEKEERGEINEKGSSICRRRAGCGGGAPGKRGAKDRPQTGRIASERAGPIGPVIAIRRSLFGQAGVSNQKLR